MIKDKVLWHDLVPPVQRSCTLATNIKVDVCVIGAGYTGLSAAIHLAEAGYSVAVLESDYVGAGGSGRNVGYVNAGTWAPPDDLNRYLGEKVGEKLTEALGAAPKLVFDMIDRFRIQAQDTRTGNLHMGHNAVGEADIDARYAQLKRRGADVEMLTGAKCHEYCGTISVNKALLDRRAGTINPYAYVLGLAQAAQHLGVQIYEQTTVTAIESQGSQWLVRTAMGTVLCDKVVIGSNAYTQGEWTELTQSIYFVSYYQIATEPLLGSISDKILPHRCGSWDTRQALSSIRRDKDNRLLFGTVGSSQHKEALYIAWANTMLKKYFPELSGNINWQYRWVGRFGFTSDHIMRVFEPQPGIVAATAYNGRGITTGTLLGKALASYLKTDNRDDLPLPFKSLDQSKISFPGLRAVAYDAGIALYHAGQCLKIIA